MNPPLRSAADRDAMIEGILDGVVDAIATDHAPHATHEKEVEFEHAPNGITGLETALGLCLRWLHREWKLPLGRVLSLLSAQPAALLGLKGRGTLAVGSFADVVVFDPKAEWTYHATEIEIQGAATRPSMAGRCKAKSAGPSAKAASPMPANKNRFSGRRSAGHSRVRPMGFATPKDQDALPRNSCSARNQSSASLPCLLPRSHPEPMRELGDLFVRRLHLGQIVLGGSLFGRCLFGLGFLGCGGPRLPGCFCFRSFFFH